MRSGRCFLVYLFLSENLPGEPVFFHCPYFSTNYCTTVGERQGESTRFACLKSLHVHVTPPRFRLGPSMNSRVVCGIVVALAITDAFAFHILTTGYARRVLGFEFANSKRAIVSSVVDTHSEHTLQRVCDVTLAGGHLKDVEPLLLDIGADVFPQSSAWSNTWTPIRCVIAEVSDTFSLAVTALPGEFADARQLTSRS